MPFIPLLALLFIGLKLTGFIAWSWWLVLLPVYGGFAAVLLFFVLTLGVVGSLAALKSGGRRNGRN